MSSVTALEYTELSSLTSAMLNQAYTIKDIVTEDSELEDFLFTLGCYQGESITVISALHNNYVVAIKDARYSIDADLAEAIYV